MELLMTILLTFSSLTVTVAVPVDTVLMPEHGKNIDMPIFSFMRAFVDDSGTTTTKPPPESVPVLFGNVGIEPTSNPIPISFGGHNQATPLKDGNLDFATEILGNDSDALPYEGSGAPNSVHFPSNTPTAELPFPAEPTDTDVIEDAFLFPSEIRLNMASANDTSLSSSPSVSQSECGPEFGSISINGTCVRFLSQGTCSEGEWFVKINETAGECVPRPCPFGLLQYEEVCVNATVDTVCRDGQMLYVDFDGGVHCDCQPNFIYNPWQGICFAQGDRGNCNFGEHHHIDEDGIVKCVRNRCVMDDLVFHGETGRCYRKLYRGFCDEKVLLVNTNDMTAECGEVNGHSIFDLPTMRACASGSLRDYAGACREEFRVPAVSSYPALSTGCPGYFVRDPRGTCRRVHKLFG